MSWRIVFPSLDQYPVLHDADLRAFEARHDISLPRDYAKFLLQYRGALPVLEDEQGRCRSAKFPVQWGDKPANAAGPERHLHCSFSLFGGHAGQAGRQATCDLDLNRVRHEHLHAQGLLAVGGDADTVLFMLGVEGACFGAVFCLSIPHADDPASFDHLGRVAPTFGAFLRSARPGSQAAIIPRLELGPSHAGRDEASLV